ncbi:hypothetical protein PNO29_00010, partial [Streptococcus vestibularis]|nr:hypothetical protein [Streptococcus vestibularis]MDB6200653.1 hypothetical protein [Streptococcus vestibularis]MDB6210454.1 hypothetical protein [Streptococcus vestibularis]MDB6215046.1 hypothetical protein [Streptococcus vestibularis]
YSSYGTFCLHSKSSIISTVVLPTTEIIEPKNRAFRLCFFNISANHLSLKPIDEKEMKFSYFFFFIGKNGDKMVN